jgi:diphthine synthase
MSRGKLTFIGLGLNDEKDISLKSLDEIKKCDKVFAEFYTAKLVGSTIDEIEKTIGKKINVLDRKGTEKGDIIIESAKNQKVVFLTAGDSMTATTHVDIRLRAIKLGIKTEVIHGSSIITAIPSLLGLQNYKFGRTTTLAYPKGDYFPTSPYEIIVDNLKMGLHTLVLLDIQEENNRYMTANEAIEYLLKMEREKGGNLLSNGIICVVARAGSKSPIVRAGSPKDLLKIDFGPPLHSLVVPGRLHFMEIEALEILAQLPAQQDRKLQKL